MARDRHRERVGRARLRHRPHRLGRADPLGDLGVARGRAGRDRPAAPARRAAGTPCRARRAAGRGRARGASTRPTTLATSSSNSASPPISVALREAVLQVAHQRVGIVAEQDGADAALAPGDQDRAERAFADGEADLGVRAAGAVVGRRHAEHLVGRRVEAAVGVEAGVVDRLGHRAAPGQLVAHAPARDAPPRRPSASRR